MDLSATSMAAMAELKQKPTALFLKTQYKKIML